MSTELKTHTFEEEQNKKVRNRFKVIFNIQVLFIIVLFLAAAQVNHFASSIELKSCILDQKKIIEVCNLMILFFMSR